MASSLRRPPLHPHPGERAAARGRRGGGGAAWADVTALQDSLEITSTFKLMKSRLVREGFDVGVITDPLFILDNRAQDFRPLTADTYRAVCEGTWKL